MRQKTKAKNLKLIFKVYSAKMYAYDGACLSKVGHSILEDIRISEDTKGISEDRGYQSNDINDIRG